MPEHRPWAILLNRMWAVLIYTLVSAGLGVLAPQIPGIATGLPLVLALSLMRQDRAVAAIEERDGVRFFVRHTCPGRGSPLERAPGITAVRPGTVQRRRAREAGARAVTSSARLARLDARAARGGSRSCSHPLRASGARGDGERGKGAWPVRTSRSHRPAGARAVRRAAAACLARGRCARSSYSSTTAALLWPRPGAIRFDATAAGNRPGRHGAWQRPLERRRLAHAPLLVPWSEGGLSEARVHGGRPAGGGPPAIVVPAAVDPSGPVGGERDIAAVSYVANPHKKGTDRVLSCMAARGARRRSWCSPARA